MPGSQLKRLKASLREQGVIGPQKSKKQKKRAAQDRQASTEKRLQRSAALEEIRESFNPFQFKMNPRGPKFQVTSNRPQKDKDNRRIRPGITRSVGEERRRNTLLVDMQRRMKVGGILDRRFGEDDPTMTPEERAMGRFAREMQRNHKKSSMFDLEEDGDEVGLTHMGKALSFNEDPELRDDFDEPDLLEDEEDFTQMNPKRLKRLRGEDFSDEEAEPVDGLPERKKSKQEVMKEVIAKSKLYKYERQAAKDEDDILRKEIDQDLAEVQAMMLARKAPQEAGQAEEQPTKIAGVDKEKFEKNFDVRLKQLLQDRRAQPSERTKTEEELAEEQAERLKEMEEKRLKRMRGEEVSESEDEDDGSADDAGQQAGGVDDENEDDEFGLGKGIKLRPTATELGFDDEDDFVIDDELVASGSDLELDEDDSDMESEGSNEESEEEDDDFVKGLLTEEDKTNPNFSTDTGTKAAAGADDRGIPFTFACPRSHPEFLEVVKDIPIAKQPLVVQRIRALYHPKLDSQNKEKQADFTVALITHLAYLGSLQQGISATIESIIRHVHSLTKSYSIESAKAFRARLKEIEDARPLALNTGDLVIFTAIGTIFPTSDHFHQVVTPAMLTMARYLGTKIPGSLADYAIGVYLCILFVQYQELSKRYVPEVMNFALNTLCSLSPVAFSGRVGAPLHEPRAGVRIEDARDVSVRKLDFGDCNSAESERSRETEATKAALISTTLGMLSAASELWAGKSAFYETFSPVVTVLTDLRTKECVSRLPSSVNGDIKKLHDSLARQLSLARLGRRPLELHHHRPVAIRTHIPKFEETFDPDKHYDANRERADAAKLKAEVRKERRGAMRELRKDAHFMAREKLRQKKAADAAYDKKYKRLIAEIQGEEGREANAYEREKRERKRAGRG